MNKFIAVMVLSALGTAAAVAGDFGHRHFEIPSRLEHFKAPEIDPSSAISGLTLLLGGLTVMRGRFAKK